MDNRIGERVSIQLAIRLTMTRPQSIRIGLLKNLSRSGALVSDCNLQLYSLIHILLQPATGAKKNQDAIAAYVTRLGADGAGIEWCDFAPPAVAVLLQTAMTSLAERREHLRINGAPEVPLLAAHVNYAR